MKKTLLLKLTLVGAAIGVLTMARSNAQTLPPDVSGNLVLQLDANTGVTTSGGNVTAWADQSTSGNNVVGTSGSEPTLVSGAINGNPALSFSGGQSLNNTISSLVGSGADRTVFVVGQLIGGNSTSFGGALLTFRQSAPEMTLLQFGYAGINYVYSDAATLDYFTGNEYSTLTSPFVVAYSSLAAGDSLVETLNGSTIGTVPTTPGGTVTSDTGVTGFTVGNNSSSQGWTGYIGEVLVYNTALSGTDIASVDTYLADHWASPAPEPSSVALMGLGLVALAWTVAKRSVRLN